MLQSRTLQQPYHPPPAARDRGRGSDVATGAQMTGRGLRRQATKICGALRSGALVPLGVAALVAALSGCAGTQVTNATSGPLQAPGLSGAGTTAPPGGVVIFSLSAENATSRPIRLASVHLLPVPGDPLPRLVHSAVLLGKDQLEDARGWPPTSAGGPGPGGTWPIAAVEGFEVPAHGDVSVAVAVSGQRAGTTLVMGGLVVQFSYRGANYRAELGMVNLVCVVSPSRYRGASCASPADRQLLTHASAYVSQLVLGH